MITDNLSCSAYLDCYGFDKFVGLFIAEIQRIYDSQGVHVNSKHIEILLKQMTSTAVILDNEHETGQTGGLPPIRGRANSNALAVCYCQCVLGLTQLSACQPSSLSGMAFHGAPRAMLTAMIVPDKVPPCIKDNLVLGRHFKGIASEWIIESHANVIMLITVGSFH
ncbi:MAG: hypothetical protein ACKESA_00025 [Candidatus Hodgkinia cicadicola]